MFSYIEYHAHRKWNSLDSIQKRASLQRLFNLETCGFNDQLLNDSFSEKLNSIILANKKEKDADISALKRHVLNGLSVL